MFCLYQCKFGKKLKALFLWMSWGECNSSSYSSVTLPPNKLLVSTWPPFGLAVEACHQRLARLDRFTGIRVERDHHPSMIRTLELEGALKISSSMFAKVWLYISLMVWVISGGTCINFYCRVFVICLKNITSPSNHYCIAFIA